MSTVNIIDTFEYAIPVDDESAPRHSVAIALGFFVGFLVLIFAFAGSAGAQAASAVRPAVAITHVNIVDVESGRILHDMRVEVSGGIIRYVGKEGSAGTRTTSPVLINGTGKYLIPGLWDMHVHGAYPLFPALLGPQYIANGVTGVREMFGDLAVIRQWRATSATADTIWPRVVASGHIVDGKPPIWPTSVVAVTEADGRHAVDSLKEAGADFIKVYSLLPRAAYIGVAKRAKELGIPYVGHVSYSMTVAEASDLGQKSIEHLDGIIRACSSRDAEFRPLVRSIVERGVGFDSIIGAGRMQNEALFDSQDEGTCSALAATLRKNGTWLSPTLTVLHGMGWADDTTQLSDPRLQYMPKFLTAGWVPKNDFRLKTMTPESWARRKREFKRNLELVRYLHERGVSIIAGTDMLNPWVFAGWSLHDELAYYVDAGLTPLEALRTATLNPARFLDKQKETGTVAEGKWADLVLLDANPLENIRNTTAINTVIADGRLVTPERRQQMLEAVKLLAKPNIPVRKP